VVQLLRLTGPATQAGTGSTSHDIGQGPSTSSPDSESVRDATTSTAMPGSVAREAPYPSHPSHPPITTYNVDLRIRALTTILSILDPQASSPTKDPSSTEFKVAVHIATLLTRGADKKKRGMMGPNIWPTAVATRTTADSVNILATIDGDDYSNVPAIGLSNDFVVTQNPTSDGPNAFDPTEVESRDLNDAQREKLLSRYIGSSSCLLPRFILTVAV
jgi:hypothetical protein